MASHAIDWRETPPESCRGAVVTIGNFDGVHLGHAALAAEARRQAQAASTAAVALTFDPHPRDLLRPNQVMPVLTTTADRAELLHQLGVDHVLVLRTTPELLSLTAAEFFAQVVQQRLQARRLVEGVSFGFGRNREGNVETLTDLCNLAGLRLTIVPPVQVAGCDVSSSEVRAALLRGDVGAAARLLGRCYRLHGLVGTGQRRGQKIGFPTANLGPLLTLAPENGVYAVRVPLGATTWPGAANVGPNPTFGEDARKVEVHLIGFQGDLYGKPLAVDFVERLRDTRPFGSVNELVEQLRRDVEQARRFAAVE
jgi:riboflavin kinase / FMN adenylyltransferase